MSGSNKFSDVPSMELFIFGITKIPLQSHAPTVTEI